MTTHRRLAAIMFTDIVGYSALMQQHEQQAISAVKRHQEILEAGVLCHRGEVLHYYGDGSLSIFGSAIDAVQCAVDIQKQYRQPPVVPLRIGIHIGEILFEGGQALGDGINVASRIESIAREGSVLISDRVFEEIKNKPEFKVKPLGAFQFKNVFQPVRVLAVVHDGLYVPKLKELEIQRKGTQRIVELPVFPNAFIGRTHHLHRIGSLLQEDTRRLITLLGPGGIGKTRLSVKVGEQMAEEFQHGVCFVALDAVTHHEQVPLYISHRLGLEKSINHSWIEQIIDFLADKHLLLILDNLEQVRESAGVIAQILDHCPRVKILATSRTILELSYETEYTLDGLSRPSPNLFPGPEDLQKFDAIDLFVQKAQTSLPGFRLTTDNAAAVVRICHELDGLPLPIELAAARVKLFSPELILQKLEAGTDLLRTKSNDVVFRHQTIRNMVRWSYDLLDVREQQLFQQLAIFRGGFTPVSLEAVCPEQDSLETIESFMNKSLIVKEEELYDIPRFRMLKVIRDHGMELLKDNPAKERYYRSFAQYFLSFVEEAVSKLRSAEQARWIAFLEAEYENLAAALEWLLADQPEMAGKLGAAFWPFHRNRGFLREGLEMVELLLSLAIEDRTIRARLLEGAGALSQNLGNYPAAKDYFRQNLEVWKALQEKSEIAKALNNLGWVEWRIGNFDHAISFSENALDISIERQDLQGQAKSLNNLSWVYLTRGLFEKAEQMQRQILRIHIQENNKRGIAFARTNLGWALVHTGKLTEAEQMIEDGIRLFGELKDRQLSAFSRFVMAEYCFENSDWESAKELLERHCLPEFEKIGDSWGLAMSRKLLGVIYFQKNDFPQAKHQLAGSMTLFQDSQVNHGEADARFWLSKLHSDMGNPSAADEDLDRCLTLAAGLGANHLLMNGHLELGRRALEQQSYEPAIEYLALADHFAGKLGAYQQERFRSGIHAQLEPIRQFLQREKIDVTTLLSGRKWPTRNDYLPEPVEHEELWQRIRQLLDFPPAEGRKDAGSTPPSREETNDPFAKMVHQIIEKHLSDPQFTVKELCREVGVSHSQLHRKISALTGQSLTQYMRTIRLNKAKELLLDPQLTIAAVAYDSGFSDPDYFYRVFKKTFNMTPGEFRNANT